MLPRDSMMLLLENSCLCRGTRLDRQGATLEILLHHSRGICMPLLLLTLIVFFQHLYQKDRILVIQSQFLFNNVDKIYYSIDSKISSRGLYESRESILNGHIGQQSHIGSGDATQERNHRASKCFHRRSQHRSLALQKTVGLLRLSGRKGQQHTSTSCLSERPMHPPSSFQKTNKKTLSVQYRVP